MERTEAFIQRFIEHDNSLLISHAWLRDYNLIIGDHPLCSICNTPINVIRDSSRVDCSRFLCLNEGCRTSNSLRLNSVFFGIKEPLVTIYRVIFCSFVNRDPIAQCAKLTGLNTRTISSYYSYCRGLISNFIEDSHVERLGINWIVEQNKPCK